VLKHLYVVVGVNIAANTQIYAIRRNDDINAIRELVRKKIIDRISSFNLDWIDVVPTARNKGSKMQTKPLVP
jgi:hypothetical protein